MDIARLTNMTAQAYAAESNASAKKWMAEEEGRWAPLLPESQDFWDSQGIRTGLDLALDIKASTVSDLYKEYYSYRPRFSMEGMSLEELQAIEDSLRKSLQERDFGLEEDYLEEEEARYLEEEEARYLEEDYLWSIQDKLEM